MAKAPKPVARQQPDNSQRQAATREPKAYLLTLKPKTMKRLTAKEEQVMEMIWEIGSCSPKDVQARFPEPRPHINTVATMFQLLERKGYLTHRQKGRGYIYDAAVKKENYGRGKLESFVSRYFGNSYMDVVSTLVKDEKVSKEELTEFVNKLKNQK